jgi:hypothetical protein
MWNKDIFQPKISHLLQMWGVVHVKVLFQKKDSIRLKLGFARDIYFKNSEENNQIWHFLVSSKVN